jgi:hypothetical protein
MIPKKIHYCWFGRGEMPQLALDCIASWHKHMPDWEYKLWNEDNFDVECTPYTKEAYEAKKYAFVSDYVRLYALLTEGGVYMDTDVEVLKPLDNLLGENAFTGYEGTKTMYPVTGIMASEADGAWATEQLHAYNGAHFLKSDGSLDTTTNCQRIYRLMLDNGFVPNGGKLQTYKDLTIYPVDYFCPRQSTGEFLLTENTYCDHHFMGSWADKKSNIGRLTKIIGQQNMTRLIKLKRKLLG